MKKNLLAILALGLFFSCNNPGNKITEPFTVATACIFSQLAYCSNPQQQADKHAAGWKIVWNATALNGNHAFIAAKGGSYVIAIRGSLMEFSKDALENWLYQDLDVVRQESWAFSSPDAKISSGAYRGWQNLIKLKDNGQDILSFLLENTNKTSPVSITGHSLGGKLGTVLASWLTFKLKESGRPDQPVNVITFAAPAAGNDAFAMAFNKEFPQSVRVENTGDVVPKFPCTAGIANLGTLYDSVPAAGEISFTMDYINLSLKTIFKIMSTSLLLLEKNNGDSHFCQTNGKGELITVKPSGLNNQNELRYWLAEARYQHGITQYATALGAPVIDCIMK